MFCNRLSKKNTLEDTIFNSNNITEKIINVICSKNLFFAEINIFWSEKKPNINIRITEIL